MDSTAFNYNPAAVADDGSCIAVVDGCTDSLALNFNPFANTDDGSCCGTGNFVQLGNNFYGNGLADEKSISVSYDGTRIAFGMEGQDEVKVMEWNGSSWQQVGNTITEMGGNYPPAGGFGRLVAISGNGNVVAVASAGYCSGSNPQNGSTPVEIYEYNVNTSTWDFAFLSLIHI